MLMAVIVGLMLVLVNRLVPNNGLVADAHQRVAEELTTPFVKVAVTVLETACCTAF
jgi:hypothetical protein